MMPSQDAFERPSGPGTLRIVHVLHSFGTGGLEKGIATVVRNASPDLEHVIVCLSRAGESTRLLPLGTQVLELRKPKGNSLRSIWRLSRMLRALRPDVVHTRNWSGMDGIVACRLAGIGNVVQGEHGWGMEDPDGCNPKRLRVRRFLGRWVKEYTCVSKTMIGWLKEDACARKRITQICNGVDIDLYCPGDRASARHALQLPDKAFVVGTVGRLDPIKDHEGLFRAFEMVRFTTPGVQLVVVGGGPERTRLEALSGDGVRFLGERSDVPAIMRAFDLFVLNSRNEGISNTILEAMATGLPVVATAVGGNSELVEDGVTGWLVSPGDPTALAAAIRRGIMDVHKCRVCGERGRRRTLDGYDIQSMVTAYEDVWRRVAFPPKYGIC